MAGATRHIRYVACALVAGFLYVAAAQGQAVRDEGFPAKPVSSEAFPASGGEDCVAVLFPGEFEERCAEDNKANAPDTFGDRAGASPFDASDPLWDAPPRLECPSAVFLEELETASIDCRAWGAAGEEVSEDAIDFAWERVGGAARDYMEHPRLTPEDSPQPLVVAPSSPFYDTLESFLAEETTKKYRYRLRATSRATGLSSFAEVDVFVLLNRPSVHCPLEVEVGAGSSIALSCEGADPLSFRMDSGDEDGRALWEWEGLWGASTDALSATDLPAPFFTAPLDAAGETYHYVASMTTTSSGVPRTARRKVSVTVTAQDPAYAIDCVDYKVHPTAPSFRMNCTVEPMPKNPHFHWRGGANSWWRLRGKEHTLNPPFSMAEYEYNSTVGVDRHHKYRLLMLDRTTRQWYEHRVTITVMKMPDLMDCVNEYVVHVGDPDFRLDCHPNGSGSGEASWAWYPGELSTYKSKDDMRLTEDWLGGAAAPRWDPVFDVPESLPQGREIDYYEYFLCVTYKNQPSGYPDIPPYDRIESEYIMVKVINAPRISVECTDPAPVYEGDSDFTLNCSAEGGDSYAWEARNAAEDMNHLTGANSATPTFIVPKEVDQDQTYEYTLTVRSANQHIEPVEATVRVNVLNKPVIQVACATPETVYEGDPHFALDCAAPGAPLNATYTWESVGAVNAAENMSLLSDANIASPMFMTPADVDEDKTYEYRLTVSATHAETGMADVTVKVLDKLQIQVECMNPDPMYEGAPDVALECSAPNAPEGSTYAWEARPQTRRSAAEDMSLLSAADMLSPMFMTPADVDRNETYEYQLTVSAENAKDGVADVAVTVMNKPTIEIACADPDPVYEGSPPVAIKCTATGASEGSEYAHVWEARGATTNTDLLSDADMLSPMFDVPPEVKQDETYEYRLTVSAENAEPAMADITVTVLNKPAIVVACTDPAAVYEGSPDVAIECTATGAPESSEYAYSWEARGATPDASRLSAADILSPTFAVPAEVDQNETYEYRLTVSAENAEPATADITVTVLNKPAIVVACTDPAPVYEGAPDLALECTATGAPEDSEYAYVWEARAAATDASRLSAADILSPTFSVPAEVDADETFEYRLTVSAENAEPATADITVTVLNKPAIVVSCPGNPYLAYEGAGDLALECTATGAPEESEYAYVWEIRGVTTDLDLLSAADILSPTFDVPAEVDQDETYEYRLTVSAENAEPASTDVTVTVLDRPVFDLTGLGLAVEASRLRFGAQAANTQVTLDPLTDRITNSLSGPYHAPYHAGRMTLALSDADAAKTFSIELLSPATLNLMGNDEAPPLALAPTWSYSPSCEQTATTAIRGVRMDATLSETDDCRLLLFGGSLDLADARAGRYEGTINVVLRSGAAEETHSVPVEAEVAPLSRMITIGPGGARIDAATGMPSALTQEQNLSVYPDLAFLTDEAPSGAFTLSNPSLVPLEISVTARFGYAEATPDGREAVVEDKAASRLGDLSEWMDVYPRTLVLEPGDEGVVRYAMKTSARSNLTEAGYAAFFEVTSSPRQYVLADETPEAVSGGKTARVTLRVPGAYATGEGPSRLKAELLSAWQGALPSATFLVETEGRPFAGEMVAYDAGGRELGRGRALIYTRSRVRMALDRTPKQGETALLRFVPLHSDRAPEPVAIQWESPGSDLREIGAAMDRNAPPSPGIAPTLAGKR